MYEILAKYYDDLMGDFDYDAYEKFALENLKDVWGGFGYDLASGSGEMAIRLKRNGFKVVGGDVSPEMLEKATEKARKARLDVPFVFSDLNDLHLEKKCDFVTVVCDGFNYVKGKNLAAAFNEIYSALNDGGIFIFDVSSANKLENVLVYTIQIIRNMNRKMDTITAKPPVLPNRAMAIVGTTDSVAAQGTAHDMAMASQYVRHDGADSNGREF